MSDLYDSDVVEWSERQGELLRRLAARQPSNEALDWENIAEEIESVGRSELNAVQSLLVQALRHDLKALAWPCSLHVPHWRSEAIAFRHNARRRFTPSMRQRIHVMTLFDEALRELPETMDGYPPAKAALMRAKLACRSSVEEALAGPDSLETDTTA